jgi:hypothetical protein
MSAIATALAQLAASAENVLDEVIDRIACRVVEKLRAAPTGMTDQSGSPLGRRRHCSAVRRRIASGESGAAIVGRKHLLSQEALSEELHRLKKPNGVALSPEPGKVREELMRELQGLKSVRPS